jgi:hypothetical protein
MIVLNELLIYLNERMQTHDGKVNLLVLLINNIHKIYSFKLEIP